MNKTFTLEEAIALKKDGELPIARLNQAGVDYLTAQISKLAKRPHNIPAYFADAEINAGDMLQGYDADIEIRAMFTVSGRPEVISLDKSHFDWRVSE